MIEADKRKAIYLLHQEGMSVREIARRLGVSRNTVRTAIEQKGLMVRSVRSDKKQIDPELLRQLYQQCDGRVQRMHEKLVEENKIPIEYSTLTRMVRELGLGEPPQPRCQQVPDVPGQEMQHDTTVYTIKLGDQPTKLVASLLYLRYSKRRYLKFYRGFNRFHACNRAMPFHLADGKEKQLLTLPALMHRLNRPLSPLQLRGIQFP